MQPGYTHGTHDCRLCHRAGSSLTVNEDRWQLIHWPAYWGSSEPDTLVLGFSMGERQVRAARTGPFDEVAFATHREKLVRILNTLGIRRPDQSIAASMTRWGRGLGYSSLARCSLGYKEPGSQVFVTSGKIMKDAPADPWARGVLKRCASTYLTNLPASVKRVVLLGSGDEYVAGVRHILREVFSDFADINPMAFTANGRTWVFAVHPSRDNRVRDWVEGAPSGKAGQKRGLAQAAIARSYKNEPSVQAKIGRRRLVKKSSGQITDLLARQIDEIIRPMQREAATRA